MSDYKKCKEICLRMSQAGPVSGVELCHKAALLKKYPGSNLTLPYEARGSLARLLAGLH